MYVPTWIIDDGLKEAGQGVTQLVLQIIVSVDRDGVL